VSEIINRAFMYGESVFTTLRMINGKLCDWDEHYDRLNKSAQFVYGPFSEGNEWALILKIRLFERCAAESGDKIIRLTIYREQARGLSRPRMISVRDLKISVSASVYEPNIYDGRMIKLRTCPAISKPSWWPSYLKAGHYLETILAQKMNMQPEDDDVLFLSSHDTVLESSVSNIFVVRHKILYTAPLGPNVLDGIMRNKVIQQAEHFFDSFQESATTLDQLYKADAVFGTNSVRGPFLIGKIDNYQIQYSQDFLSNFDALRKRVFL
jgi:branched-subunit amino acid aminotransferase/4-amino-4-deoxychorismate lyase